MLEELSRMPGNPTALCGCYTGVLRVRPGRESELSPQERKQLQKAAPIDLHLSPNGSFSKQITEGIWTIQGSRILFEPTKFGGKSLQEMQKAAEDSGRAFGLAFVFNPFELVVLRDLLVTPDTNALIYTEYSRS